VPSVKSITLVNGLKIVHVPHNVGSVTACLRGLAGSNYERDDEVGAAHVLEHLCTYATRKYNLPNKLRNVILLGGGRVTGTTSRDDVAFFAKVLKKDLSQAIEYLYQIFSQPILSIENLEKTKNIIEHEIYKLPLKKVVQFKNSFYYPANFVLSVCGDFPSEALFKLVEKYFGKIEGRGKNHSLNLKPNYKSAILLEKRDSLAHMHLKIDYHGYKTNQKRKYSAYLLATILKNRLKAEVSNAPYILDSSSFNSNSYGLFGTYTAIKSTQLPYFLDTYKKVVQDLCTKIISQQEFLFVKNKTQADFEFALEKTSLRADFYSELYLYQNLTNDHKEEISRYVSCTTKDILGTSKDIFSQDPKITIIDKNLTKSEAKNCIGKYF